MDKNESKIENTDEKVKTSQSTQLVTLIEGSDVELFHDEYGVPFARIKIGNCYQIWKIRSKNFKRWICNKYWNLLRQVPNNEALNSALNIIEAKAYYEGKEYKLENRIAFHLDEILYDLGNWTAVRLNQNGWGILSEPPIVFRSFNHQKEQVIPERCKEGEESLILDDLLCLINIEKPNQKLLFLVNLVCMFIPHIPRPIFVLHGDQGTAKTTTSTIIKELTDPSVLKNLRIGNSYAEFIQQASHHYVLCLDNLTYLPTWMSDALCRLVTGEGFSKRELYTNDDDIIYSIIRSIVINGINLVPNKPDLLDRCLIFELEPISKTDRLDEAIIWKEFNEMKPKVLGAIFSVLSKAIKIYPTIYLKSKPRMADFTKWGAAIAESLGNSADEFLNAYNENIELQNAEALEANPIAKVIINFMECKSEWTGSPTDLFHELSDVAESLMIDTKDRRYPRDPRWLWRRIKEVKPNLEAIGITIEKDDSNHTKGRQIYIRNLALEQDSSSKDGKFDVHNVRNVRVNGQQDNTVNILDNLLKDDTSFSESKESPPNEHSEVCDCEECIPKEET